MNVQIQPYVNAYVNACLMPNPCSQLNPCTCAAHGQRFCQRGPMESIEKSAGRFVNGSESTTVADVLEFLKENAKNNNTS